MRNGTSMRGAPSTENLRPRPRFCLNGGGHRDEDDFGGGDGDGKAFPDPTPPRCHP